MAKLDLVTIASPCLALVLFSAQACAVAKPTNPPARIETVTKGYYTFTAPPTWTRTDAPVMTKHEPAWELPRPNGNEAVVALVHQRLSSRENVEGGDKDPVRRAVEGWKTRWGAITVTERTQPVAGAAAEAKVFLVEHVMDGRAILAAVVDLSAVDARTRGAYTRVAGGVFELEGPEARVLGAKAEFDAMVRSVGIAD